MTHEGELIDFNLCEDSETEGFDLQAGRTWIYPTNYPIRDYQYNIVQQALLKNTLVSLPTGLGKTFIAAVVMYNFFRWYPLGKVIFMAPTRPLVKQQIEACYDIMAIPKSATVELTGSKLCSSREHIWKEKRVFFITPQILQNDLEKVSGLSQQIKCLVFDEAHRARGNHAYCEVVRKLVAHNKYFRVLALSATPGSTIGDVLEVVNNLLISHLEFRTEESPDVERYVFEKEIRTIVVPLGEKLQQIRDDYLQRSLGFHGRHPMNLEVLLGRSAVVSVAKQCCERLQGNTDHGRTAQKNFKIHQVLEYYTKTLIKYNVLTGNCANLTKGRIFMTLKDFQQRPENKGSSNYNEILKSLNICVTLYHGFELLVRHGLRSFLSFFDEHVDKPLLRGSMRLIEIIKDVRDYLGPEPVIAQLPDGSFQEIPETSKFGHPKFYVLRDELVAQFKKDSGSTSRVIVFFEYRNSVKEAYALLNQSRPLLRPRIFLGQGRGVTQNQQLNVVKSFKEGQCNILLSTCIGEEGLDIGDVDLIICFDISTKSPIRMVQRMGRTGRKKEGSVIALVTEGKEQQILKDSLIHKNNIAFHVLSSKELARSLKTDSPRLVPAAIEPKCDKLFITVEKPVLTKNSTLKDMFRKISSKGTEPCFAPDLEIVDIKNRIPEPINLWDKGLCPLVDIFQNNYIISNAFSKRLEKQRVLQPTHLVRHSASSELLVNILQQVDSKRFNLPATQVGFSQFTQNRNLKQGDIRNMFLKSQTSTESLVSTQDATATPILIDLTEDNSVLDSKKLLSEISDYLAIQSLDSKKRCRHCPDNLDCSKFNITSCAEEITWIEPDQSVFTTVTLDDINKFFELYIMKPNKKDELDMCKNESMSQSDVKVGQTSQVQNLPSQREEEVVVAYDSETGDRTVDLEKTYAFQAPKSLNFSLNRYSTSIIDSSDIPKEINSTQIRTFFKLEFLKDVFQNVNCTAREIMANSPDIIEDSFVKSNDESDEQFNLSPVLCTFERARNIKNIQRNRFNKLQNSSGKTSHVDKIVGHSKPNLKKVWLQNSGGASVQIDTPSKFTAEIVKCSTPLSSKSHEKDSTEIRKEAENKKQEKIVQDKFDIDDLCDLSIFGLSTTKSLQEGTESSKKKTQETLYIDDICDLEMYGIGKQVNRTDLSVSVTECGKITATDTTPEKSTEDVIVITDSTDKKTAPGETQISITQMIDLINSDENNFKALEKDKFTTRKTNGDTAKWLSPKINRFRKCLNDSFITPSSSSKPKVSGVSNGMTVKDGEALKKVRQQGTNPFIEDEAEVSEDDVDISEDEFDAEQNFYDASFVDDHTQHMDTQMHVKYLQTTRSPKNQGRFKIPQRPRNFVHNVYSQDVHPENDTYLDDSFVVFDDEEEVQHELSELEILEKKLRNQKKKRKKSDDTGQPSKRRRIQQILSDSDSD